MYEIISCAKDTRLNSFPDLEPIVTSPHVNTNGSVCQFFVGSKLFLRANKNWGVEMLRIRDIDGKSTIAQVKKFTMDNLYCVACPKKDSEEIAVGLTSGAIRLINFKKLSNTKRFDADRLTNGVTHLDFSSSDEFLAAVYESGSVNLYGTKTNSRIATMTFDKHTTKVRFHPTKRFLLSVASYNGSVMLYDTQTKKIVFNQIEAHGAPCRDIAMTETNGDLLYSVGYDNIINIFDTRKKMSATQISANYPFESLDVSQCGIYFAVGNLKGHIYGYDIRNLAEPVKVAKIHDSIVNSVSFILKSNVQEKNRVSFDPTQLTKNTEITLMATSAATTALAKDSPIPTKSDQDSFMGDIDMFLQRRDSIEVQMGRLSTSSRLSADSRGSLNMAGNNLMGYLDDISDNNSDIDQIDEAQAQADESFVNVNRLIKRTASIKKQTSVDRTQRSTMNLENIREEPDMDNSRPLQEIHTDPNVESQRSSNAGAKRSSLRRSVDTEDKENLVIEMESATAAKTSSIIDQEMPETVQNAFRELRLEISNLRQELRGEMKEYFYQNQVDRKYTAMTTRSQIWMGSFNLWQESQKRLEKIDEVTQTGFGLLLSNDEFTQQFIRLQRENDELKRRLAEMESKGDKRFNVK